MLKSLRPGHPPVPLDGGFSWSQSAVRGCTCRIGAEYLKNSWRSGRKVMIRSQVVTAEPPQFFRLAAQVAAGRLYGAGKESSTQSSAPECHLCQ